MRKISANRILPVSSPPLKNGIITVDGDGRIMDLLDTGGMLREEPGLEYYSGLIVPGFVIPWLRLNEVAGILKKPGGIYKQQTGDDPAQMAAFPPTAPGIHLLRLLDRDLLNKGIKGI